MSNEATIRWATMMATRCGFNYLTALAIVQALAYAAGMEA